jgi:hypothetical protein
MYTHEQVKNIFANAGCELLSQYYTAREAVQYRCSCGTISFISLEHFLQWRRCKKCGQQKSIQKRTLSQEYVTQYFKEHGCELLDLYVNNLQKLKYRCSCGNIAVITFSHFQQGKRCWGCRNDRISKAQSKENHYNWNLNRSQIEQNKEIKTQQYALLAACLRRLGTLKEGHTDEILGYSASDLNNHLRSFPHYNYLEATGTLAIDHVLPVKAFIEHGIIDPAIICALDNLQPLSKSENSEKNDWYLEEDFIAYCQKHNISLLKEAM